MESTIKVSIVTVCRNSEDTIGFAIESACKQVYSNIEHIIIDGGSIDNTVDIVNRYKSNVSKFISEKDQGIYDAMNKGIRFAKGEIIGFLNADDVYASETVISEIVAFMQKNCLEAVYGDLVYIDRQDSKKVVRYWKPGEYKIGAFYRGWVPPHPTFFCRKEVFEKFGYFNDSFQIAADFELMLRFIEKHKIHVGYLPRVIVKMRTGGKANVLRGIIRGNCEIVKSFRLNGLVISPWFFLCKPMEKIRQFFKLRVAWQ